MILAAHRELFKLLRAKNEHRELLEARIVLVNTVDFFILLIPTPLVCALFCSSIPSFCSLKKMFFFFINFVGRFHMNPDSIRIESSFVQSSSRLIRIESESRSHEQISSCINLRFMCTIFIARRKCIDLLFSLQYQEVFQRAH